MFLIAAEIELGEVLYSLFSELLMASVAKYYEILWFGFIVMSVKVNTYFVISLYHLFNKIIIRPKR